MQRKRIVYTITYLKDNKIEEFSCTIYSLEKMKTQFVKEGAQILSVIEHPLKSDKTKSSNLNKSNINKYYNSQYTLFYKRYKKDKISKSTFDNIITKLKELKSECTTREDFEKKFEEYKKSLTYIPI